MHWIRQSGAGRALLLACAITTGCHEKTGGLTPAHSSAWSPRNRPSRRRPDLPLHPRRRPPGRGWEDRKASIIVTKQSVIITRIRSSASRSRRGRGVRGGAAGSDRVRISAGAAGPPRAGRSCRRTTPRGG